MRQIAVLAVVCIGAEVGYCRTIKVRADGTGDYPTIQAGIDAAKAGDEVVMKAGTYRGEGNRDLNFGGKAITVRSVNPENNSCMCKTIIDAEGVGVIVRFINDEGPGSVFEGFTLGAGDTSKGVRGEPGFFEFSKGARPTTRRLRNKAAEAEKRKTFALEKYLPSSYDPNSPGDIPPFGRRAWDGYNPFHQPANTTDYYGSGDVDNDGDLTSTDVSLAQDMADGSTEPVSRADVDGDGDVDGNDVSLIDSAVSGGTLAAWWNSLTSKAERNNWVDRVMAIDQTDKHTYYLDYFVCHHFAYQTGVHGAFLRADFATKSTEYNGGQTVFNVPLYYVSVSSPSHAINAILVGDNPLNFEDWRFVEPQNDWDVVPGQWNMLYGSHVGMKPQNLYWNEWAVVFYVDASGGSLVGYGENLVMTRPVPEEEAADNRTDLWNPRFLSKRTGSMLYEQMREDMSRTTDIHIADFPLADAPEGEPLILDEQFCRLLDVTQGRHGTIHLLWEGVDVSYRQAIFHGTLDPVTLTVSNVTQVSPGICLAASGRIVVTPDNDIHIFWFENSDYSGSYDLGIHWTKWDGTGWATAQKLTSDIPQSAGADWVNRNFALYIYDAVALGDGDVLLVWNEEIFPAHNEEIFPAHYISQLRYDGTWSSSRIEDTGWNNSLRGVDLCKDSNGIVHLAYWRGDRQQGGGREEGRGNLYHRSFDGVSWSSPVMIDDSGGTCCPRMAAGAGGEIYLVWERKVGSRVFPVRNKYTEDMWGMAWELSVRPDANAWHPTVETLADGRVLAAWSSRSFDWVTIETKVLEPAPPDARSDTVESLSGAAVTINLEANDDGFPDPPGALTYIITSLPRPGSLSEPGDGLISDIPYVIANYGNQVVYTPDEGYLGLDEFTFKANDGGTAPDGGDSDTATISIELIGCIDTIIGTDTFLWGFPMHTSYPDSRTQVIYLSSEIGRSGSITALALDVGTVPGQTMNNWTIRMKHTTMSTYTTASLDATGWTVVYEGNEPPGGTGWRTFEFSTPFDYNDTNNLLVDFSHNNDSDTTYGQCVCSTPGGTRGALAVSDSAHGDPLDWSGTFSPHVFGIDRVPNVRATICAEASSVPEPILVNVNLNNLWMYQSIAGQSNSDLTAGVSVTDDPMGNSSYSYEWEIVLAGDVSLAPVTVAGGGVSDGYWTLAARGCDEPGGLSDSGQTFTVRVTVTGDDYGNTGQAEIDFGIALLGDTNNDGVVNVADRSIANAFWRTGSAGPYTLRDCDVNCDGVVNVADRSIANAIWRGILGQNSVSSPCPLR